ncbi:hypothetical protein GCM10011571_15570 [Marinithermofilum abyssi]|uniref:Sporulation lipoprotein, YhcN/YlaJ family n=1 Tax=Marinithermofilum abyssi TaxID=1571185 RepID=A0A8J2VCT1_9BACL|nr:YhcN/YlaJ family sporulation lipoprotein [Marinithermofilum abyssi]GGE14918.1 hypothetical protein GCM10011571_15570 [Marinithermofilum abyssi]
MLNFTKYVAGAAAAGVLFFSFGCAVQKRPEETQDIRRNTTNMTNRMDRNYERVGVNMRVADDVASSVAKLKTIDSATVVVTDSTAYVGVLFEKDYKGGVTNRIKTKVSRQVRKADPSVTRVFVSANPDFVSRIGDMARDIRNGRPIAGIRDSFMELVRRTFPTARQTLE